MHLRVDELGSNGINEYSVLIFAPFQELASRGTEDKKAPLPCIANSFKATHIMEEMTPRPVLDLDNLEEHDWPEIDWTELTTEELEDGIHAYRILQKHLMITYKYLVGDDDPRDPDPYAKYYVFYCLG
jgi:hypothetical protein